jgi:hypothetical protein
MKNNLGLSFCNLVQVFINNDSKHWFSFAKIDFKNPIVIPLLGGHNAIILCLKDKHIQRKIEKGYNHFEQHIWRDAHIGKTNSTLTIDLIHQTY